nr:MAG TPA: hypothetical protein [Caudoviricetes sp.]
MTYHYFHITSSFHSSGLNRTFFRYCTNDIKVYVICL